MLAPAWVASLSFRVTIPIRNNDHHFVLVSAHKITNLGAGPALWLHDHKMPFITKKL